MDRFKKIKSIVTPFDKVNVDTDQIVPKQFLKLIQKNGFGKFLITQDNFGCGSSREHAVWALQDYGFSVIIAPSFADIFFSNCFKNGLLAIILNSKIVEKLLKIQTEIEVDLENQIIKTDTEIIPFQIDEYKKKNLLNGLDEIALTLKYQDKILEYEKKSTISSLL